MLEKSLKQVSLAISFFVVASACAPRGLISNQEQERAHEKSEVAGPVEPTEFVGPIPESTREVSVVVGPGMASSLSGAGALRAIHNLKLKISAVGGVEFGGYISSLYAMSGSVNRMDWGLLQLKESWVRPSKGISRLLNNGGRKSTELHDRLRKTFQESLLKDLAVPAQLFIFKRSGVVSVFSAGRVADIVCRQVSRPPMPEHCVSERVTDEGSLIERESARGSFRSAWGARPVIWVIPSKTTNIKKDQTEDERRVQAFIEDEIERFEKMVVDEASPADLVVRPNGVLTDYFDFSRRSEIVYSGQQATSRGLEDWIKKQVWKESEKKP